MSISNIDDLLMGGKTPHHPETPENQHIDEPEEAEELETDSPDYGDEEAPEEPNQSDDNSEEEEPEKKSAREYDDYGNEKEPENEVIRERLARQARKHEAELNALRSQLAQQGASQQVQQAAKDFEYDPDASGDWQQQLASFVKQTVNSMTRDEQDRKTRQQEMEAQHEFEGKFKNGMNKFDDFADVISSLPFEISNPMTLATRAMSDPAAFLYAAAKRNPQELERISKMRDPYAQMAEMGKLEERMRRNKPTTKAPRPLSRDTDDAGMPAPKKNKELSIEDLITKSDAKKLNRIKGRQGGRR